MSLYEMLNLQFFLETYQMRQKHNSFTLKFTDNKPLSVEQITEQYTLVPKIQYILVTGTLQAEITLSLLMGRNGYQVVKLFKQQNNYADAITLDKIQLNLACSQPKEEQQECHWTQSADLRQKDIVRLRKNIVSGHIHTHFLRFPNRGQFKSNDPSSLVCFCPKGVT